MCKKKSKHRIIKRLFALYRYLFSPWVGNNCRFYPTCSAYTELAIDRHGLVKGSYLGFKRILKCNPWHPGGIDEVPDNKTLTNKEQ